MLVPSQMDGANPTSRITLTPNTFKYSSAFIAEENVPTPTHYPNDPLHTTQSLGERREVKRVQNGALRRLHEDPIGSLVLQFQ